jgi:hypothetical protein
MLSWLKAGSYCRITDWEGFRYEKEQLAIICVIIIDVCRLGSLLLVFHCPWPIETKKLFEELM